MKKTIITALLILATVCVLLLIPMYVETHYTKHDCIVAYTENQTVVVEDKYGELWSYECDGDTPEVGTRVSLRMHTNWTMDYVYDDIVINVK